MVYQMFIMKQKMLTVQYLFGYGSCYGSCLYCCFIICVEQNTLGIYVFCISELYWVTHHDFAPSVKWPYDAIFFKK